MNHCTDFVHYGAKLTLYSYRSMTMDGDGLNAFSGILQHLGTMYKEGFFRGLPIADFQWDFFGGLNHLLHDVKAFRPGLGLGRRALCGLGTH